MVPTRSAVRTVHSRAVDLGNEILHEAQNFSQYPLPYFACFWLDPFGFMLEGEGRYEQVGIFAQRARMRPNRIGVVTCRLLNVEGQSVRVADLDAMDSTPVLDINPHMIEMGPMYRRRRTAWAKELVEHYWA
jgi:hypothetical protein